MTVESKPAPVGRVIDLEASRTAAGQLPEVGPTPEDLEAANAIPGANPFVGLSTAQTLLAAGRWVGALGRHPLVLSGEVLRWTADEARVLAGVSTVVPDPKDKRFADPAWQNPLWRRVSQSYLVTRGRILDSVTEFGLDDKSADRARFALSQITEAAAPTNALLGNPAALRRAAATRGRSLARGGRNAAHDLRHNGGMPSQVDLRPFRVGETIALTPGEVIHRTPMFELIQYTPTTRTVRKRPTVVIPPQINRFYFLDLAPGRSFVEYAVSRGLQVFMISWRNPDPGMGELGMDSYAARIQSAMDVVSEICDTPDLSTVGFCAGGILMSTVLNRLAATGAGRVRAASFAVTLLDFDSRAALGAFSAPRLLELAQKRSRQAGVITGRQLGNVFSWMRPDDLVFNYWVSNYLMGDPLPVFDILAWNADSTNLPARLHAEFLDIFQRNTLCRPGAVEVLGSGVDLSQITIPTFVTGAITDHLTPWKGCYRTTELVGGPSRFVLSNAGHIASLVNPPGNPKATYYTGGETGAGPDAWFKSAAKQAGTWWEVWADWTLERSGDEAPAPAQLGSGAHPALAPAPGWYVRDKTG